VLYCKGIQIAKEHIALVQNSSWWQNLHRPEITQAVSLTGNKQNFQKVHTLMYMLQLHALLTLQTTNLFPKVIKIAASIN
jgi:hypothetical protein